MPMVSQYQWAKRGMRIGWFVLPLVPYHDCCVPARKLLLVVSGKLERLYIGYDEGGTLSAYGCLSGDVISTERRKD